MDIELQHYKPSIVRRYSYDAIKFYREKDILLVVFPNDIRKMIVEIPFINFLHSLKGDFRGKYSFDKYPPKITRIITPEKRLAVLKRQNYYCNICGAQLKNRQQPGLPGWLAHIDHVHPFSLRHVYFRGMEYINELDNLQALCGDCNMAKGTNLG